MRSNSAGNGVFHPRTPQPAGEAGGENSALRPLTALTEEVRGIQTHIHPVLISSFICVTLYCNDDYMATSVKTVCHGHIKVYLGSVNLHDSHLMFV